MVHIKDEGGTFDAPIDVVWKFLQSPEEHGKVHRQRHGSLRLLSENQVVVSWEQEFQGRSLKLTNRITLLPPLGFAVEALEGPFAGSKFVNYYLPRGPKTEVTIVGEFTSKTLPEAQVPEVLRAYLELLFQDDSVALRRLADGKRS